MAELANLARNRNVYTAASESRIEELDRLDFREFNRKALAQEQAELKGKQDLAKMQDTGLYEIFASDIRRRVDDVTKRVESGELKANSQEYFNLLNEIRGYTQQYKQQSDLLNERFNEVAENPDAVKYWDGENLVDASKGVGIQLDVLNTSSKKGETPAAIMQNATNRMRNYAASADTSPETLKKSMENSFAQVMKHQGIDVEYHPDGVLKLTETQKADKNLREAAKAVWITTNANALTQMWGESKKIVPNGENKSQYEDVDAFSERVAESMFPTEEVKMSTLKANDASERSWNYMRGQAIKQKNQPKVIPKINYNVVDFKDADKFNRESYVSNLTNKGMDKGLAESLADAVNKYEVTGDNINTVTFNTETKVGDEGAVVAQGYYNPKTKKYTLIGSKPDNDTKKVTKKEPIFKMNDYDESTDEIVGYNMVVDYDKTKLVPFRQSFTQKDFENIQVMNGYTPEEAKEFAKRMKGERISGQTDIDMSDIDFDIP